MRNKKRRAAAWWGLVIAIVVIAGGVLAYRLIYTRPAAAKIVTAEVDRGDVKSTISATGIIQPLTTVDVKSNVGGTITQLAVDEGVRVTKGQLIARIDPSDAQTALDQQRANLLSAEAKVDQSFEQSRMQDLQSRASVESATQGLASAEQSRAASEQSLEAARQRLAQAEATAQSQPALTSAAIRQAQSGLATAVASLKQMKEATIPQRLASTEASLDQAKANLDYAGTDLARQRKLLEKGFVAQGTVDAAVQRQQVAKASCASAQRAFDTLKAETDEDLNVAQAKVDQAQAALDNAKTNAIQDTLKTGDVLAARASVRQAEAGLKQAEAGIRSARAALDNAKAGTIQSQIRRKDIVTAQSGVANSKAAYQNAVTALGYTTISAPCDGVVVKKFVDPGSIIAGARTSSLGTGSGVTIIQIADTTRMFALVNVDETDIAKISLGQRAELTVDAFPNSLPFDGTVTKIAPQASVDQNVTTVPVTVEIHHPDPRFKPTMNVNCQFIVQEKKRVLRVPNEALSGGAEDETTATVKIPTGSASWKEQQVSVGFAGDDYTEITDGLQEGDTVVTQIVQPQKSRGATATQSSSPMGGPMGGPPMGGGMRGR